MAKPLILTTCGTGDNFYSIRKAYVHAIENAGGEVYIIPSGSIEGTEKLITIASGLLLTGGVDIHPNQYGEDIAGHYSGTIDEDRFVLEEILIKEALHKGIPIIGICRGLQAINTYFGGTLHQDIASEIPGALLHSMDQSLPRNHIAHAVSVMKNSKLFTIIEEEEILVNSLHHQAIKKLGDGLNISAQAPDGVIEGIEHPDYPFLLGVQWHPEELIDAPSNKLFQTFLTEAKDTPSSKE